ncbi:FAD-dependent oxidoreductase [Comamonas serinivorans]|uniref:FAD-dependent oxidoreductase n=1 Tax=Comamonas serinivorans TaxID=1082851 RepID=A0A1Y0EPR9_9BURK|nr:NAD(P)/FAD-dependent oxidoreductase [Comamonas serinivorans]ARU05623.1 FAD-dependent oxidoreductase [Comamonas serinivorans]
MDRVDAVVVGAGAVGLAVGRALAQQGHEVVVLEKDTAIGQGVSSRNSEVIHAGLYYAPGSLKARLCVAGKAMLYALCERHHVPHQRCGKLVVATDASQHAALDRIAQTAATNGVPVEWKTGDQTRALEPALNASGALWSPSTGIVDSHAYMLAIQAELEHAGGVVALGSALHGAQLANVTGDAHVLTLADGTQLATPRLVNAAALHACQLATRFEGLAREHVPTPHYAKGSYYTLAGKSPFTHLVYPAPVDAWLGVHVTLDLGGQARFGPDLEWLDTDEPDAIDYRVQPERAEVFYAAVRHYWPGLPDGALQPAYSGVRPKIHAPGTPAPDWRIDGPALHGVPGLVNLFGIESPGLTSALAIGEHVAELLR